MPQASRQPWRSKLGLKLEQKKAPLDLLIIDRADKVLYRELR
jgi:uncharacterized protein (TIGR03435 family)